MNPDIRYVIVREPRVIPCRLIEPDGSFCESWLGTGRHCCEGTIERGRNRFVRLRSTDGELAILNEKELLCRSGRSRRIYRKRTGNCAPERPRSEAFDAFPTNLRTITPEKRQAVRRQRSFKPLPGTYLGSYRQLGSFESWAVRYSIGQCGGEWIVYVENGPERLVTKPLETTKLVDAVQEVGIGREDFLNDLRKAELVGLVEEIERI
jgi:hypothetical protein